MGSSGRNDKGEPVVQHCVMLIEAATRYMAMALSPRGKAVGRSRRALCLYAAYFSYKSYGQGSKATTEARRVANGRGMGGAT